jgi:hypothetical protein
MAQAVLQGQQATPAETKALARMPQRHPTVQAAVVAAVIRLVHTTRVVGAALQ